MIFVLSSINWTHCSRWKCATDTESSCVVCGQSGNVIRDRVYPIPLDADLIWSKEIRNGETVVYEFYGPSPTEEFLKELFAKTELNIRKWIRWPTNEIFLASRPIRS